MEFGNSKCNYAADRFVMGFKAKHPRPRVSPSGRHGFRDVNGFHQLHCSCCFHALKRAAISFAQLADTARLELPNTMAAIRLSSMEISDLKLELNDLKQELLEGVTEPGQVVQGSEAGANQIGAVAYRHSLSKRNEMANLPCISLQPVLPDVGKKNSRECWSLKKWQQSTVIATDITVHGSYICSKTTTNDKTFPGKPQVEEDEFDSKGLVIKV
ncbi:hypothetical protein V2J09_000729 [Rumex salicifolius]